MQEKLTKIKLLALDVDGVLTDGTINIGDNGELLISDFIIHAGTGTGKAVKGIHELTVSQFTELANVMDNIYTVAVEANKIKTVK